MTQFPFTRRIRTLAFLTDTAKLLCVDGADPGACRQWDGESQEGQGGLCHPTPGPYSHTPLVVWHIGTASFWKTVLYGDTSLVAQRVKLLPVMQETPVQSLGQEDPLEKEMATHSRILAWRIPWTEEPGGLQSIGSQRVGHD